MFENPQPDDIVQGGNGRTCKVATFNEMSEEARQIFMKGKKPMLTVNAICCPKCGDTIYSRARHDFHGCTCGSIFIDGGRDYMKVSAAPEIFAQLKTIKLELDVTDMQLYEDWAKGYNVYGLFNEPVPVQHVAPLRRLEVANLESGSAVCMVACKFNKSCANHETAGIHREEGGFSPDVALKGGKLFCATALCEAEDPGANFQNMIPKGWNGNSGFVLPEPGRIPVSP